VYACCSHPVFSDPAIEKHFEIRHTQVWYTNTIPLSEDAERRAQVKKLLDRGLMWPRHSVHPRENLRSKYRRQESKRMATAIENYLLEAQPRTAGNKNEARGCRRGGKNSRCPLRARKRRTAVSVDPATGLARILGSETGHNTIFDLALNGGGRPRP